MGLLSKIIDRLKPKKISKPISPIPEEQKPKKKVSIVKKIIRKLRKKHEDTDTTPAFSTSTSKKQEIKIPRDVLPEKPKKPIEELRKDFYEKTEKPYNVAKEEPPKKSDIILQELERRIASWESDLASDETKAPRVSRLRTILEEEIRQYGRAKVAYSCEQAGHTVITNATVYVFDSDQNNRNVALTMFTMLIRGEALSEEDAKSIGNEADSSPFDDEDLGFY